MQLDCIVEAEAGGRKRFLLIWRVAKYRKTNELERIEEQAHSTDKTALAG